MELEKQISQGIMDAMKAKDDIKRDTLRNVKKLILEAKAAGPAIDTLSDEQVLKIIGKLAKQGADSAEVFSSQGREDLASYERAQVEVLESYLPARMSAEEITEALRRIIEETGADGMKDMGKVMGIATKQMAGKADGKDISAKVRELLS